MGQKKLTDAITVLNFPQALVVLFTYLKLTKQIDWSWWWITAPIWGQLALAGVIIVVVILFVALFGKGNTKLQIGGRNNTQS